MTQRRPYSWAEIGSTGWRLTRQLKPRVTYVPFRITAALIGFWLATFHVESAQCAPMVRGFPPSDQRFWARIQAADRETPVRVGIFVERLIARTDQTRRDQDLTRRLYASAVAAVELSALQPQNCGELGYYVGHVYAELGASRRTALAWLECALEGEPRSALAFKASLEVVQLRSMDPEPRDVELALNRAAGLARDDSDWAALYLERGLAYERDGKFELASGQYAASGKLSVDETSRALAGWYYALCLDRLGDHATAMAVMDAAEARAYERVADTRVAVDLPAFRCVDELACLYSQGVRMHWLALRRRDPSPKRMGREAIEAFEELLLMRARRSSTSSVRTAIDWHLHELRRMFMHTRRED